MALLDLLQVIAFSKRTGCLQVTCPLGQGAIVFDKGTILFAYSPSTFGFLRQIKADPSSEEERSLFVEKIEIALKELTQLQEGSFQFQLTRQAPSELDGIRIPTVRLLKTEDHQRLLLSLAEEADEKFTETKAAGREPDAEIPAREPSVTAEPDAETPAREPTVTAEPDAETPAREPTVTAEPEEKPLTKGLPIKRTPQRPSATPADADLKPTVVLVDDEPMVTRIVGTEITASGYSVLTASGPSEGVSTVRSLIDSGKKVLVVTDLRMPTSSGRSFFGGFELVHHLRKNSISAPVLLMTEKLTPKARAWAKKLGIQQVAFKPALSKLDQTQYQTDLRSFASVVRNQLSEVDEVDSGAEPESNGRGDSLLGFLTSMTKRLMDSRVFHRVSAKGYQVSSIPFVEGTSVTRGSTATALRKAFANALKIPSIP